MYYLGLALLVSLESSLQLFLLLLFPKLADSCFFGLHLSHLLPMVVTCCGAVRVTISHWICRISVQDAYHGENAGVSAVAGSYMATATCFHRRLALVTSLNSWRSCLSDHGNSGFPTLLVCGSASFRRASLDHYLVMEWIIVTTDIGEIGRYASA